MSDEEKQEKQDGTKGARIVLDAREDIFLFGTEDMQKMVNDTEDSIPDIRQRLVKQLRINKAGTIIGINYVFREPDEAAYNLAMALFINQVSLRGILDKLDLQKVAKGVETVVEGVMKLGPGGGGRSMSEKTSQTGKRKGPTYGG